VLARRARLLAWGTNAWHVVEFAVAVASGIAASSTALVGFGVDSLIEALAGPWSPAATPAEQAHGPTPPSS
jgi:hypothetical protein